jgi:hypothetical protein
MTKLIRVQIVSTNSNIIYISIIKLLTWVQISAKYFKSFFIYHLVAFAHCAELIERNFIIFESKLC